MLDSYVNFDLRLSGYRSEGECATFDVTVTDSKVGGQVRSERVAIPPDLKHRLIALETRKLDANPSERAALGWDIGRLLMPGSVHDYFLHSLGKLDGNQGLRIRIHCADVELEQMPWEFACVRLALGDEAEPGDLRSFLALSMRVSITRYVLGSQLLAQPQRAAGACRVLVVACEPSDLRDDRNPLQIDAEIGNLTNALAGVNGVRIDVCSPTTRDEVRQRLVSGADVFHFAGHGDFLRKPGVASQALLMLTREDGSSDAWQVDELSRQLAGRGVRLAMLGACRSAQADGLNSWAGIAASLVRAGVPVVVGMQYGIFDPSAIAFSRTLYRTWSQGTTIDEAVSLARSAIADKPELGRDFGTPVLYMRMAAEDELLLAPQQAMPATQAAVAVVSSPEDLANELTDIERLRDYKFVHDILHSARMQQFSMILMRCPEFPGGTTCHEFRQHSQSLRKYALEVRRIGAQQRCEARLMEELQIEFEDAIAALERALNTRSLEDLGDAVAAFETMLDLYPTRIDTLMSSLARHIDLDRLYMHLRNAGVGESGARELRCTAERLRAEAAIHALCQNVDRYIGLIRREANDRRFQAIRRHWQRLAVSLADILPAQDCSAEQTQLRAHRQSLEQGLAANDPVGVARDFEQFCGAFDYGFFTVDLNLKQLCGEMTARVTRILPQMTLGRNRP